MPEKKSKLKKTNSGASQLGTTEDFKKHRDIAFQKMLKALENDDEKEYKKQYKIYRNLSAGASASKGNTQDESLNMTFLKNRKIGNSKGGMVDYRKTGLFK